MAADAGVVPVVGDQHAPAIASDGAGYLVTWLHDPGGLGSGGYGARVSADGNILDPSGIEIGGSNTSHAVASNGASYVVLSESGGDLYVTRMLASGFVERKRRIASSASGSIAVATNGTGYLVAWRDFDSIRVSPLSPEATAPVFDGIPLTDDPGAPWDLAVASNGSDYLVVWDNRRDGGVDLLGRRVSADGVVVDAADIPLSTVGSNWRPSVAWNGAQYLLVWNRNGEVLARLVSADGVADTTDIAVTPDASGPHVVSNGTDYFVASLTGSGSFEDQTRTVQGHRISAAGEVLDPAGIEVSSSGYPGHEFPSVASNGSDYFVVWQTENGVDTDIRGGLVSAGGDVVATDVLIAGGELGDRGGCRAGPTAGNAGPGLILLALLCLRRATQRLSSRAARAGGRGRSASRPG